MCWAPERVKLRAMELSGTGSPSYHPRRQLQPSHNLWRIKRAHTISTPTLTPFSKNLPMASLPPTKQVQGTLGTEEVPGSFLSDFLLILASLLAKHSREAQPSTSRL